MGSGVAVGRSIICVISALLRQLTDELLSLRREFRGDIGVCRVEHLGHGEVGRADNGFPKLGSKPRRFGLHTLVESLAPHADVAKVVAVPRNRIEGLPLVYLDL